MSPAAKKKNGNEGFLIVSSDLEFRRELELCLELAGAAVSSCAMAEILEGGNFDFSHALIDVTTNDVDKWDEYNRCLEHLSKVSGGNVIMLLQRGCDQVKAADIFSSAKRSILRPFDSLLFASEIASAISPKKQKPKAKKRPAK